MHTALLALSQYILQWYENSQISASSHCHSRGTETRKERKWIFTGFWYTKDTEETANIFLSVAKQGNLEYVSENNSIKQGVGSFTSL